MTVIVLAMSDPTSIGISEYVTGDSLTKCDIGAGRGPKTHLKHGPTILIILKEEGDDLWVVRDSFHRNFFHVHPSEGKIMETYTFHLK